MTHVKYDLPDLRALFELARQGGFNRAADALAITPSALSKRIAKIEAAVGGAVVERTTRDMQLTALGQRMLNRAEPLLMALDNCLDEASRVARGMEGSIAIGCVATLAFSVLPRALSRFQQDFPDVRISLRDGEGSAVTSAVANREVEFALTTVFDDPRSMSGTRVATDPFVLVCGAHHPLAQEESLSWAALKPWKLAGFKPHVSTRKLLDKALAEAGIELSWFYELGLLSSLLGFLKSGEFVSPVPRMLVTYLPGLIAVPLTAPVIERSFYLVRRQAPLSLPAQALWDAIAAAMAEGEPS